MPNVIFYETAPICDIEINFALYYLILPFTTEGFNFYSVINLRKWSDEYAITQLQIVCSGSHLVTYLNVGNFWDQSTGATLHEVFVQVFLRSFDSNSQTNPQINHD